ncbi:hypothetical protein ACFVUN_34745 [Kitasatospora griseola]|uniref:hypothetical protein n=1 Tax=Kitasatospora griseola TaxID=2064 RepID=UPI0036D8A972
MDGWPKGEGVALIERVEHVPSAEVFLDPDSEGLFMAMAREETMVFVFCQGMPGPLLLRPGDHRTADRVDGRRLAWDEANPTWAAGQLLFRDAVEPASAHWSRNHIVAPTAVDAEDDTGLVRAPRRAASFAKPVHALMEGHYLQIHQVRFPEADMGVDEGVHRVEAVRHLPAALLHPLLSDPAWAGGDLVLATVHGVPGTLLLPGTDVTVLTAPNPERRRSDETGPWTGAPFHDFTGVTAPDPAHQQHTDRALRPQAPAGEAELYPSRFTDPAQLALHMNGVTGVRPVPLAALPWPHSQHKCAYTPQGKALALTYPGGVSPPSRPHRPSPAGRGRPAPGHLRAGGRDPSPPGAAPRGRARCRGGRRPARGGGPGWRGRRVRPARPGVSRRRSGSPGSGPSTAAPGCRVSGRTFLA